MDLQCTVTETKRKKEDIPFQATILTGYLIHKAKIL